MRRATSPAICRTSTLPRAVASADRGLLVVEARLLRRRVAELAGVVVPVGDGAARPDTGSRGQSKTFMKIEIRSARPPRKAGSSISITLTTLPSAGATTSRSPAWPRPAPGRGRTRPPRSRARARAAAAIHQPAEPARSARSRAPSAIAQAPTMNQRPSGAVRITRPLQLATGDEPVRLEVAAAGRLDHLGRERRRRRLAVPLPCRSGAPAR